MGKLARRPMTADRFLRRDMRGYEFVDGRVQETGMGAEASWIQARLQRRVGGFVEAGGLGEPFEAEVMFQCFPHKPQQIRKPDVSFVRTGRLPGGAIPKGAISVAPDLVAEVVSPNERADDLAGKVDDFVRAGVPLIWVIYPDSRTVTVHTGRTATTLTDADDLTGDPVLPGFRLAVADLFPPAPTP
jgi:Uma2 family endonuclease